MSGHHGDSTQRIGEFLVRIGAMTKDQVDEVLAIQRERPDKLFGQIAIELGYVNDEAVDRYVSEKLQG